MRATSHQIADDLRRTIADGRLRAGDRVPSTRQITREWGVAMATATRALALLQADGLVRSAPGVGTVVLPQLPSSSRSRTRTSGLTGPADALDGAQIVARAVRIADTEGLAAVTVRRLAAELGPAPMTLYRHITDKDELLVRMMDAALAEWRPGRPGAPGRAASGRAASAWAASGRAASGRAASGWRLRIELATHGLWRVFRSHPWLAPTLSLTRPQPLPGALAYSEEVLSALSEVTDTAEQAFGLHLMIMNWVRGVAINLEPEREAEADTGVDADRWTDEHAQDFTVLHDPDRAPVFTRTLRELQSTGYDLDLDALFATGLAALLNGLRLPAPAGARAPSGTG